MDSPHNRDVLRVGLLGAGIISSGHATALQNIPQAKLVAVCDAVPGRAADVARDYGIPEVYESAKAMLRDAKVDVVHVLTPPQYHTALALECMEAGRHVLIEKPMGLSAESCAALESESRRRGLVCAVNHNATHFPVVERLAAAIGSCRFGRVNHISCTFCVAPEHVPVADPGNYMFQSPANMIFEFGPHPFSIIRLLMGGLVKVQCVATGERTLPNGKRYWNAWQFSAVCERGTASLYIGVGTGMRDISLRVFGEDAVGTADLVRDRLVISGTSPLRIAGPLAEGRAAAAESLRSAAAGVFHQYGTAAGLSGSRNRDPFLRSLRAFYEALSAGRSPREDVSAGKAVVEYCEEAAKEMVFVAAHQGGLASVAVR
jgi:predicted dehydrogenase